MHHDMEFTMHLRGLSDPAGDYTLTAELYYETRNPPQDRRVVEFVVPEAADDNVADAGAGAGDHRARPR